MFRHGTRVAMCLALATGALGIQVSGATVAHACGTYVDGVCAYPTDPVVVDGGTGPVMVDGLSQKLDMVINEVNGKVSGTITNTTTQTVVNAQSIVANSTAQGQDNHNYGTCYSNDSCTNLQLYEPTYEAYFNPSGDFQANGVAEWSELVPSNSQNQQFWIWDEHSLLTSQGSNLCILTNSAEMQGNNIGMQDQSPGASVYENSNATVNVGVAAYGVSVGGSFTLYRGEMLGEVYNSGTGYVASWREQNDNCAPNGDSIELKDQVMWHQDWNDAPNASWKVETQVWYQD